MLEKHDAREEPQSAKRAIPLENNGFAGDSFRAMRLSVIGSKDSITNSMQKVTAKDVCVCLCWESF